MPMSQSCNIDKYIGSDFDAVKDVAENLQAIKDISIAANDLDVIGNNIDSLMKLANNLDSVQITELFTVTDSQQVITATKVVPQFMALFVRDQRVDSGRLFKNKDYEIVSASSFKLKRTYPEGTQFLAVQEITAEDAKKIIYDERTVFNRKVVSLEEGNILKDEVMYGETLQPLLIYNQKQYLCQTALPIEHTITSNLVYDYKNGYIKVTTDKGGLLFNEQDARALTQKDIRKLFHNSWSNIILRPPSEWLPEKWIDSITYRILVEGVEYFPVRVPFTTEGTWEEDKHNWLPVINSIPTEVDVTGESSLILPKTAKKIIIRSREEANIVSFSDIGNYREITLIPESDNITLVHSKTHLRLASGTTLKLSTNSVYKFMTDSHGIPRQVV